MLQGERRGEWRRTGLPPGVLRLLFLIVFLDLLGFSLILPLLPFYAQALGASASLIGLLIASNAVGSLIGSPIVARISDRVGRRPILIFGIFGTLVSFTILGLATSVWMLFISRTLDGLTGAITPVAQAYVADITSEQERARGLGVIGAAFGLGFIIGPAIGGLLSTYGFGVPSFAAAGLTALALLLLYFRLPESLTPERREALVRSPRVAFSPHLLWRTLRRPLVGSILSIRFFYGLASAIFQGVFSLYAFFRFGASVQMVGFILTYVGGLIVFVQLVAIGWLTARVPENRLIVGALVLLAVGLAAWALSPNIPILLLVLAPLALAFGVLNTVLNSVLSKAVPVEQTGGILGISTSVDDLTRVIGPSSGGILLQGLGTAAPGLVGAAIVAALVPYAWRRLARQPGQPPPSKRDM